MPYSPKRRRPIQPWQQCNIGDIHGRLGTLEGLLAQIDLSVDDRLVFLGDHIDRGPDSFGVVERILTLRRDFPATVTLRGIHEELVAGLLGDPTAFHRESWLTREGGQITVASYQAAGHYLAVHREFFTRLPYSFETERYFFCHAGVRPGVPRDRQNPGDLTVIRQPFLTSKCDFGKIVVHGHTVVERPQILPNRIDLDTGAAYYGPLTAMELPLLRVWQQE